MILNSWVFIYLGSRIKKVSRFTDIWSKRSPHPEIITDE